MEKLDISGVMEASGDGVRLRVKVVPGASRDRVVGLLGDRLKVQVSAPPEGGRANAAVCEVIAGLFGLLRRNVIVETGQAQPQKMLALIGLNLCQATEVLQQKLSEKK